MSLLTVTAGYSSDPSKPACQRLSIYWDVTVNKANSDNIKDIKRRKLYEENFGYRL